MTDKISEFFKELNLEIESHSESYNELELTSFFEVYTNYLIKAEVIETAVTRELWKLKKAKWKKLEE